MYEADQDPAINGLFLALDVICPGVSKYYLEYFRALCLAARPGVQVDPGVARAGRAAGGRRGGPGDPPRR